MPREAVFAGQFYPGSVRELEKDLDKMIKFSRDKRDAIGAISPHAGYIYSGSVAGEVYGKIRPADSYVILSPNHTGEGARFAVSTETWVTPLGEVPVDTELARRLMSGTKLLSHDEEAHLGEHSIEVQLPFIQKISPSARIVPITVKHANLHEIEEVAEAISLGIKESGKKVMIIASSDMSHYDSRKSASGKDHLAIQKVIELDPEGLLKVVVENNITMCGYLPSVIMLKTAKKLGAKKAELVRYSDSGDQRERKL
jgi:AmmeMemoRadiSam system protein B